MRYLIVGFIAFAAVGLTPVLASMQLASPTTYFIEDGKNVAGFDAGDREFAEFAFAAWSRESGGRLKFVRSTEESNALIRIRWISAAER